MSEIFAGSSFPKYSVHAGAALVGLALLFAGVARTTDLGATRLVLAPVSEQASLRFLDNVTGGVRVETEKGAIIAQFSVGEGGFLRGVMRGFARERRAHDAGAEAPFLLARHADGKLTLTDPVNGRTVELDSFGPSNAGLFAGLLKNARDAK